MQDKNTLYSTKALLDGEENEKTDQALLHVPFAPQLVLQPGASCQTNCQTSSQTQTQKRLLLLATGGTIASKEAGDGLEPGYSIQDLLSFLRPQSDYYAIDAKDILALDSSNMQPEDWIFIAEQIRNHVDRYDGIVITHGTDTMAYTASILSFMLQGIPIPVVLTGSQRPIDEALTDARMNLDAAFSMAASAVPGVFLAFGNKIILGSRAVKTHTTQFSAFESINIAPLARIDSRGLFFDPNILTYVKALHEKQAGFKPQISLCPDVFLLKIVPGLNPNIFKHLLEMGIKGLVIEAFGIGGIQQLHRDLIPGLEICIQAEVPVVVTSQCLYEHSDFSLYATGRKLLKKGVIEAFDMTSEAAVTKLMWALAQNQGIEGCRRLFAQDLVGEIHLRHQERM